MGKQAQEGLFSLSSHSKSLSKVAPDELTHAAHASSLCCDTHFLTHDNPQGPSDITLPPLSMPFIANESGASLKKNGDQETGEGLN